ncbi:MAG: 3-phosphoshikimate 1-carboxyvinyltransferase [Coriobacteriia bacterium]|jgi:3-phosphoshikimate 1-carboxyvinyltransferase|nr:3-phosphoshikimate 1-carboxyvinyltransferase [Coriobacteriia bacterium]
MDFVSRRPPCPLTGTIDVPGDKSLSHRAILFAAMAEGASHLSGILESTDVQATINAVRALGAEVESRSVSGEHELVVTGWGSIGPKAPREPIDCENSGTTARLLSGMLAGWNIEVTLHGDASLSRRPMKRVIDPLEQMGARFESADGRLPITVRGGGLTTIAYEGAVASAQIKTAVLLAGMQAEGRTSVREPAASRDHTERLLPEFGVSVGTDSVRHEAWVDGPVTPVAANIVVPGDPSSAAFIIAAGLLVLNSEIAVRDMSINPTRVAFLDVIERMGADVMIEPRTPASFEPVGTVHVRFTRPLHATTVRAHEIPALIDEIPVLALIATQAEGVTRFEHVNELRVKESDRLAAIIEGLTELGAHVHADGDDLLVCGPSELHAGTLYSRGDHRLAMAWALAGLISSGPVTVKGFEAVDVSYPGFARDLSRLSSGTGPVSDVL